VKCLVDNRLGVMEIGLYTNVIIEKGTPRKVLSVPLAAVRRLEQGPVAFVADEDSRLAVKPVKTGVEDFDNVEIVEGLSSGDVAITSDVGGVNLGTRIKVHTKEAEAL
jgi:multidrug efflux pump subunit AcrA (membrane-fusion protein)